MTRFKVSLRFLLALGVISLATGRADAAFVSFIIRGAPTISPSGVAPDGREFIISVGGQKAGYGSDDINGYRIDQIADLKITRYDDTTRFTPGSGPAVAPYFNIWVTDGLGHYAAVSAEPSNPDFQPLFVTNGNTKSYDLSFANLADKTLQVYETANGGYGSTSTWVHDLFGHKQLTFADIASLTIAPPPPSYIAAGNGVGSGAPRDLTDNTAYGFNWIFGDTLTNYVSGQTPGYIVGNAVALADVAPTPEPTSTVLLGLGAAGFAAVRRRRKQTTA